jgi:hypothetical protein
MINVENHAFSLSVNIDTIGKISYFHYHYCYREKMDFRSSLALCLLSITLCILTLKPNQMLRISYSRLCLVYKHYTHTKCCNISMQVFCLHLGSRWTLLRSGWTQWLLSVPYLSETLPMKKK